MGLIAYSVGNPSTFIRKNKLNGDWYHTGNETTDKRRWMADDLVSSIDKTIYDPCPSGWDGELKAKDFNLTQIKLSASASVLYPASGYIDAGTGSLTNVGNEGR